MDRQIPDDRGCCLSRRKAAGIFARARGKGWQLTGHCQGGGAVDAFWTLWKRSISGVRCGVALAPHDASFQSPERSRAPKGWASRPISRCLALSLTAGAGESFCEPRMRILHSAAVLSERRCDHRRAARPHDRARQDRATNPYNPFLSMWIAVARRPRRARWCTEESHHAAGALRMHTMAAPIAVRRRHARVARGGGSWRTWW